MGLKRVIPEEEINVIVNTAEDIWVSGNRISPDVDAVMYALAGIIDESRWWGIKDDTFLTHETLKRLGHDEMMMIGEKDRATHIIRSELLRGGMSLTEATARLSSMLGVKAKILPMTDDDVRTMIRTPDGTIHLQQFWVGMYGKPEIEDVYFDGIEDAKPTDKVLNMLSEEETVLIGPSNPISSIFPILGLVGDELKDKFTIAISPIIGDRPISGPAGKMMRAKEIEISARGIFECYKEFLDVLIIDERDDSEIDGLRVLKTDTMMVNVERSIELAKFVRSLQEISQ
jgi:LPPG:FO 2-phospho-L-lactate transferase